MLNENGKLFYQSFGGNLFCDKTIFTVLVAILACWMLTLIMLLSVV